MINDYSNVNLNGQQYAGGSNGAYFANDEWNNPWLVKSYPGAQGQDRAASELLANSIYRTVGAQVPQMGMRNHNGQISISYPLVDGEQTRFSGDYGDMAKRQALGQHLATDALVGNWDFAGLEDDNVLWDKNNQPIRIDPGGSFEFRAQGAPKHYGPEVDDLNNLLAFGQAKHGVLTDEKSLRNQAHHIGQTLTPDVVHNLVNDAPFQNKEMQERIRHNLLSRVGWMQQFANGQQQLSPEAHATLQRHQQLLQTPRISSSPDELHISLKVPRYAAKVLFRWARDQEWPLGTRLEDPNEYHCTLLYSPEGYNDFHKSWWIPDIDKIETQITHLDNFGPNQEGEIAYVLRLDSEELQIEGEKIQQYAASFGVIDTHFGGYKPHITIGYGYSEATLDAPNMILDLGPSELSTPRRTSGLIEHFSNDLTQDVSLETIAHNLHDKFKFGTTPTDIVDYASRLLKLVGYPQDRMTTQAALQAWQMMYPNDQILKPNEQWQIHSAWDFNSGFEKLIDQYSPYGLSCLYDETPQVIDISHLEVNPAARNSGIGSKFMQAAHQYAQSVGKQLSVSRVDNVPFFSKFPFLNQQDEKTFTTAAIIIPEEDEEKDWDETNVNPAPDDNWQNYQGDGSQKEHDVQFGNDSSWLH